MQSIQEAATAFLANKRVAVTGVSRTARGHGSNLVYQRLRQRGYHLFGSTRTPTRSRATAGIRIWGRFPGGVDAIVIGTWPETAENTMHECAELGIKHVWMHRGPGIHHGHRWGLPMMFGPTADVRHRLMRLMFGGHVPERVCPSQSAHRAAHER